MKAFAEAFLGTASHRGRIYPKTKCSLQLRFFKNKNNKMKQPSELSTRRSTPTLASTPSPAGKRIGSNIFHQLSATESGWVCPCTLKPRDKDPPLLFLSNLRSETKTPNQEPAGFYWKRVAHILPACQVMAICEKLNFFYFGRTIPTSK